LTTSGNQVDRLISREDVSPQAIASVQWWLTRHPEDVIAATDDGDDILIISGEEERVVWVNPDGGIKVMKGGWEKVDSKPWTVKMEVTLHIDQPTDGTPANQTNPMLINVSEQIETWIRNAYSPDGDAGNSTGWRGSRMRWPTRSGTTGGRQPPGWAYNYPQRRSRTMVKKYFHVGNVYVDSGLIYIGDPASILNADKYTESIQHPNVPNAEEFFGLLDDAERSHPEPLDGAPEALALEPLGEGQGLVFPAGLGDGIYPVTLRMDKGRVTSMIITFDLGEGNNTT
jgi:hypothetical protein